MKKVFKHLLSKDGHHWFLYYFVNNTPLKYLLSDKLYLTIQYRCLCGKPMNWDNPQTFNEKLQWLKLYSRNPDYTKMVDKYEVKKYIASIIGEEYIIPTLGVWDKVEDITWNLLPDQFVLKCTHDSGGIVICRDKKNFNMNAAIKKLKMSFNVKFYYASREWPYKNIKPKVIAEKYMEEESLDCKKKDLTDFKFFCFNGEPKFCQVIRNRNTKETIDIYDMDWKLQDFVGLNGLNFEVKNGTTLVKRPHNLDEMIIICRKISKDICFVRVDLYNINGKIYFGEMTFYPYGGMGMFTPNEYDMKIGELIKLPIKSVSKID